ncbi:MAG: hypothetical protein R3B92_01295 [Patescibacteria group bacterium]
MQKLDYASNIMSYKSYLKLTTVIFTTVLMSYPVAAQDLTSGVAVSVPVSTEIFNKEDIFGKILSYDSGTFAVATSEYDPSMYGVVVRNPVISLQDTSLDESLLVVSQGTAYVTASNTNGNIYEGDFITSSSNSGIAQLATRSGTILGVALEDLVYDNSGKGELLVSVDIRNQFIDNNLRVNLLDALRSGYDAPFLTPVASLRYILAVLIILGSFILGFSTFGRSSTSGIQALGRNPLAKSAIQVSMMFNFLLTALIMFLGLFLAYLVLTL